MSPVIGSTLVDDLSAGCDIWNIDETGFRIGMGGDRWITTLDPDRTRFTSSPTDRTSVTSVEPVDVTGDAIPPMFIHVGRLIFASWVTNDLEDDTLLTISDNGFTNDLLSLRWLQHFEEFTAKRASGAWQLLLLDGQICHLSKQISITAAPTKSYLTACHPIRPISSSRST